MKTIFAFFCFLTLNLYADITKKAKHTHIGSLNTIIFFASEDTVSSGHFKFKNLDARVDNYFFPFSFLIKSNDRSYDYYLAGNIGFSNYTQNNIYNIKDQYSLQNYALKFGGGIQYYITKDTDFMLGASYIYSYLRSSYSRAERMLHTVSDYKIIDALLNRSRDYRTFEVSYAFRYHPYLYEYKPYSTIELRHFYTYLNKNIVSKSIIRSTIFKLKVGIITPELTKIFDMSLTLEPYASILNIFGDIRNSLGLSSVYIAGNTFRLNAYAVTCWIEDFASLQRGSMEWIREITLDMNIIKGDDFKGFNIGLGIKF